MTDTAIQSASNLFQVLAYIVGPILLGVLIYYGISRTWDRKGRAVQDAQDNAVRNVYSSAEAEREAKERAAASSSNPIDVAERKSGTTG